MSHSHNPVRVSRKSHLQLQLVQVSFVDPLGFGEMTVTLLTYHFHVPFTFKSSTPHKNHCDSTMTAPRRLLHLNVMCCASFPQVCVLPSLRNLSSCRIVYPRAILYFFSSTPLDVSTLTLTMGCMPTTFHGWAL